MSDLTGALANKLVRGSEILHARRLPENKKPAAVGHGRHGMAAFCFPKY
jgi:hypothetical protein